MSNGNVGFQHGDCPARLGVRPTECLGLHFPATQLCCSEYLIPKNSWQSRQEAQSIFGISTMKVDVKWYPVTAVPVLIVTIAVARIMNMYHNSHSSIPSPPYSTDHQPGHSEE